MKRKIQITIETSTDEEFVSRARKALGMTQKEFADAIGVSITAIQSLETGRLALSTKTETLITMLVNPSRETIDEIIKAKKRQAETEIAKLRDLLNRQKYTAVEIKNKGKQ